MQYITAQRHSRTRAVIGCWKVESHILMACAVSQCTPWPTHMCLQDKVCSASLDPSSFVTDQDQATAQVSCRCSHVQCRMIQITSNVVRRAPYQACGSSFLYLHASLKSHNQHARDKSVCARLTAAHLPHACILPAAALCLDWIVCQCKHHQYCKSRFC